MRRAGSTPSSGTGPSAAFQGSYYMYVEASGNQYEARPFVWIVGLGWVRARLGCSDTGEVA